MVNLILSILFLLFCIALVVLSLGIIVSSIEYLMKSFDEPLTFHEEVENIYPDGVWQAYVIDGMYNIHFYDDISRSGISFSSENKEEVLKEFEEYIKTIK